ncbi:hypothetical protein [Caulobacter sp.]
MVSAMLAVQIIAFAAKAASARFKVSPPTGSDTLAAYSGAI